MRYFLKIMGYNDAPSAEDFNDAVENACQKYWEKGCIVRLSEPSQHMDIDDEMIMYAPLQEKRKTGTASCDGRVLGWYRVVSKIIDSGYRPWTKQCLVENLCHSFSKKSKDTTILRIDNLISNFDEAVRRKSLNQPMQAGLSEVLDATLAKKIINEIKKLS